MTVVSVTQIGVLAAYALIEWYLPRTNAIKGNSSVELLANALKPVLRRVPFVNKLIIVLATPEPPIAPLEPSKEDK